MIVRNGIAIQAAGAKISEGRQRQVGALTMAQDHIHQPQRSLLILCVL